DHREGGPAQNPEDQTDRQHGASIADLRCQSTENGMIVRPAWGRAMAPLPDTDQRTTSDVQQSPRIRVEAVPICPVCGGRGEVAYEALIDRLCGAPGEWRLQRCLQDGALWLDPRPIAADLPQCYPGSYFTHASPPS